MTVRPVPDVEDNPWIVQLASGSEFNAVTVKRDSVEPVPIGTYVVMVFRVTGYDQDCDGSLMARLAQVDRHGEESGWEPTHIGLYPDSDLVVDDPGELWPSVGE